MMRHSKFYTWAISILLLPACSNASSSYRGTVGVSEEEATAQNQDQPHETETKDPQSFQLGLKALDVDDASKQLFDFKAGPMISMNADGLISFATPDGKYVSYDAKLNRWGSVQVASEKVDYDVLYYFGTDGYLGVKDDVLTSKIGAGKIERIPFTLQKDKILSAGLGFYASSSEAAINLIRSSNNSFSQTQIKTMPAPLKLFKSCVEGCIAWGYDGTQFYVLKNDKTWGKLAIKLTLPEQENVADINLRLKYGEELAIQAALVTTESGKMLLKDEATSGSKALEWKDVSRLAVNYCVPCHGDDGFDKEATWASLKSPIMARLKASNSNPGAMPPPNTKAGKEMSGGDKALLIKWLEGVTEGKRGSTGDPNSAGTQDTSLISGTLKTLSDQHCLGCHADAQKTSWWKARKASAAERINLGSMPPGSTLGADTRASFVSAIQTLP